MNKLFNTLETLRILLEHKGIMFSAIREMDRCGDRYINEAQFALTVLKTMNTLDATEQQRVQIAFSTENLLQAHILADKDSHNGITRLIFQEAVIGLFRLCDASLYQELTDSKLKSRLAGLWRVQERFVSGTLSFYEGDPDYTELVDDTFEQLSMLLDVLKRNVVRMKALSQEFESMSTEACKDPNSFVQYRQELLANVTKLFERHIKPTQVFLNPQVRLSDGDNLFDVISSIQSVFEANGKLDNADQIFRFSVSFAGIFKPITEVAHQVDQFLRKTRASMAQFNAMEHHFQHLLEAYGETLDHKLNKTKIDSSLAKDYDFINGLKKTQRPKDFRISDSTSYFENLFAEIEVRLEDKLASVLPDVQESWRNEENSNKLKRAKALYDYLTELKLRPTDDLTAALHYRLKDAFEDYQFTDLLSAVTRMRKAPSDYVLRTTNKKAYISHNDDIFVYRRKRLVSEQEHLDGK